MVVATTKSDTNAKRSHLLKRPKKETRKVLETRNKSGKKKGKPTQSVEEAKKTGEQKERYVVVITNVENDFAKVHQEAIQRFCCLDERYCYGARHRKLLYKLIDSNNGGKNGATDLSPSLSPPLLSVFGKKREEKDRRQCHYKVIPRTETRSVEVVIYGKADGDVSSVYIPAFSKTHNGMHRGGKNNTNDNKDKNKKSKCNNSNTEDGKYVEATPGVAGYAAYGDNAVVECVNSPTGVRRVFQSPLHMVATLRRAPYFTHPPKFLLNMAGRDDGEILLKGKPCKLRRVEGGESQSGDGDAKRSKVLLQSSLRQADLITAVATTSSRIHTREISEQLKDIPGFINCWMLYPQHFRVVFATKKALFRAKELLDQFSLDSHVRVSLELSDSASKEFTEHLASAGDVA